MDSQRRKRAVAWLSVLSNATLATSKLVVGLLIGSVSVVSEAIHSGVDLVASVIALVAVRSAGKPADEEHPYGHGKIENISGTIEALLIFIAAIAIIVESVHKLLAPRPIEGAGLGVGIMLISAIVNWVVSGKLFKVGRETDSIALQADAWHLRADVYTSAGVMAGLLLITIGRWAFPRTDLAWIDPVAAIIVALLIVKAAWELTANSVRDLLDATLPKEEEEWIRKTIVSGRPQVLGFHELRTRKAGSTRFIDFHLVVPSQMTVKDSHEIAAGIARDIRERFPGSSPTVHVDPCEGECREVCRRGCFLTDEERAMVQRNADEPTAASILDERSPP